MKKLTWRDGNHIAIQTGHATFDRQADLLSTGNVVGDVQLSFFVRPKHETECNGFTNPEGHLRDWDLNQFKDLPRFPRIRRRVIEITDKQYCILYEIRTWGKRNPDTRRRQKTIHGYILTAAKDYKFIEKWVTGPTWKSRAIIEAVIPYISNP